MGEPVVSGIYFYTFTAGGFTATGKVLIQIISALPVIRARFGVSLMDCTSERIETYTEEFDMGTPTKKLKQEKVEAKQPLEEPAAARGLEGAYSDDEPEYTLDMLIAVNPDYKGSPEKCKATLHLPARGLEGAYDDDEPEYTLDMLISVS